MELEQELYAALGVTPREDAGEKEADLAVPPDNEQEPAGEKETEAAEPSANDDSDSPDAEITISGQESPVADNAAERTSDEDAETRRKFAAMRREREAAEREKALRENIEAEYSEVVRALGLTNTDTGAPIETIAQLREYREAEERRAIETQIGTTPDALGRILGNLPEIAQLKKLAAELEAQKQEAQRAEVEAEVGRQIADIAKHNPNIKSLDDVMALDRFEEIRMYVQKHNFAISDAYKLVYRDKLEAAEREAKARERKAREASTLHLKSNGAGAAPDGAKIEPTTEDIEMYRLLHPDMPLEEIRTLMNRFNF